MTEGPFRKNSQVPQTDTKFWRVHKAIGQMLNLSLFAAGVFVGILASVVIGAVAGGNADESQQLAEQGRLHRTHCETLCGSPRFTIREMGRDGECTCLYGTDVRK